jgi:hypothetical protein
VAKAVGSITFDVILRTRGEKIIEHTVGEVTVPVRMTAVGGRTVEPADIEQALGALGPEPTPHRTRAGRRKAGR